MVLLIDNPGRKRLFSGFRVARAAYLQAFESVVETMTILKSKNAS